MSLEYGFGLYNQHDPELKAKSDAQYEALSEADKKFYHDHLCWMLLAADIRKVTAKSIPHILARCEIASRGYLTDIRKIIQLDGGATTEDFVLAQYLEKFIGYECNIATSTTAEFVKKIADRARMNIPLLSKKDIPEIEKVL